MISALRRSHFPSHKYKDLGLELGLHYNTLSDIEANNPRKVEECLKECLAKWLSEVDSVYEKGKPTWRALVGALEKIGDRGVACCITSELVETDIHETLI